LWIQLSSAWSIQTIPENLGWNSVKCKTSSCKSNTI
jgi:hypothetical protein